MDSSCPFCHIILPFSELEQHANNHFLEDDLFNDMELARQIALAPESPASTDENADILFPYEDLSSDCIFSRSHDNRSNCLEKSNQNINTSLAKCQKRGVFYKVEDGIMSLLQRCLEKENKITSIITGYIDHYQSGSEDTGWGCGWRNIQMLSSHLLAQRQEVREVVFGGSGFIPDIPSLQRWLEIAWERGFDVPGSNSFDQKIYGSRKWIGTTECAALLRSFGVRAKVVDFDGKSNKSSNTLTEGNTIAEMKPKQVCGPMDKFLIGNKRACPVAENGSAEIHGPSSLSSDNNKVQETSRCSDKLSGPHILANWVWSYFMEGVSCGSTSQNVLLTEKTPLYFQHDGHSRTIVGIQRLKDVHDMPNQYVLLVLDPAQRTAALERALKENSGWQRMLKRGVHTLRKSQYQLCYVNPGIATAEELNQLKTIHSVLVEI